MIRFALAPWSTFRAWRQIVLELTVLEASIAVAVDTPVISAPCSPDASDPAQEVEPEQLTAPNASIAPPAAQPPAATPVPPGDPCPAPVSVSWALSRDPRPTRVTSAGYKPLPNLASSPPQVSAPARSSTPSVDPRAVAMAQRLADMDGADTVTGPRVGRLLGLDIAPRTGRRLLGQARKLLNDYQPASDEPAPHPRLAARR